MIPIGDEIPNRKTPIVNISLIVVNIIVFIIELTVGLNNESFFRTYALIPDNVTNGLGAGDVFDFFTSMFMHAGPAHIIGNMLYLWIFGDNVEDAMGSIPYLIFYLAGGIVASAAHILSNPDSTIPTVGASGAIAAALGAYLVLYPQAKVRTLVPIGYAMTVTMLPAIAVLGLWFVLQLFQGVASLGMDDEVGGVAVWAHIGGFVFGFALGRVLGKPTKDYGGKAFR